MRQRQGSREKGSLPCGAIPSSRCRTQNPCDTMRKGIGWKLKHFMSGMHRTLDICYRMRGPSPSKRRLSEGAAQMLPPGRSLTDSRWEGISGKGKNMA